MRKKEIIGGLGVTLVGGALLILFPGKWWACLFLIVGIGLIVHALTGGKAEEGRLNRACQAMTEMLPLYLEEKKINKAGGYTAPTVDWFYPRFPSESHKFISKAYEKWLKKEFGD